MPPNAGRVQPLTHWRVQSHAGGLGRRGLLGSFESEKLFHEYDPEHVPKPIAFGNYKENPETWFFLAEFHDMVEEQPDIKTFVSIVANWHKKSMESPPMTNGDFM
jgi:protein-ribulosamine 3-kinase